MSGLMDEGRAVIVIYPDFGKTFSTVSHSTLIDMRVKCRLDKCTVRWAENTSHTSGISKKQ